MFNWFLNLFKSNTDSQIATRVPESEHSLKPGDKFVVNNPDHAREIIFDLCCKHCQCIIGSTEWNPDGSGVLTIDKLG